MNGKVPPRFDAREFRPAPLLPSAHAQTIGGRLLRRARRAALRARTDRSARWRLRRSRPRPRGTAGATDAPIVLLMHGLEGSARRGYAINTYRDLAARGVRAVGLNFRSCSGEMNRSARFYHSGDTADIEHVLRLLADRHPAVPRGVVGFSLGGNAMLKLLGELGSDAGALVDAAAAISVPYDLGAGADWLDRSHRTVLHVTFHHVAGREGRSQGPLLGDLRHRPDPRRALIPRFRRCGHRPDPRLRRRRRLLHALQLGSLPPRHPRADAAPARRR
jgi:predicted alpha/beta-fold hydrolase